MQLSELSDKHLITSYLKGNNNALELLILRHKSKVYTSIMLLVKDKEMAEDIFQETFIKVINTLKNRSYKEEGKFLPWVIRIAHNLVIDHFRRSKRMPLIRDTEEYSIIESLQLHDDTVEDKLVKNRIDEQVRMLIDLLPIEQREVVIMRHFSDMSFKDIAERTDVSINTALGRMRYALINLRKIIEEKELVLQK